MCQACEQTEQPTEDKPWVGIEIDGDKHRGFIVTARAEKDRGQRYMVSGYNKGTVRAAIYSFCDELKIFLLEQEGLKSYKRK